MSTATKLLTVEEFDAIPNPPGGVYELFNGELVFVGYPEIGQTRCQRQLRTILSGVAGNNWVVDVEWPYRAEAEYQMWAADVAVISVERFRRIRRWLEGAPDLVVEVLSPSSAFAEMETKAALCLANGAKEFWMVNPDRRSVTVYGPGMQSNRFVEGQSISLAGALGGGELAVSAIFAAE
ncbi:MAG: Uma2 family endonuclease [Acidobacteria bacterium]|nr:Uma2 family endonuclease [Acidobacteriota bacterium]